MRFIWVYITFSLFWLDIIDSGYMLELPYQGGSKESNNACLEQN